MNFDHRIDWENVKTLKSESHVDKRRFAESILINQKGCLFNVTNLSHPIIDAICYHHHHHQVLCLDQALAAI